MILQTSMIMFQPLIFRGVVSIYPDTQWDWYIYLSNEKNPGWLFDIGDYTTQLYRDYNKPL